MKTIGGTLLTHLASEVTTVAVCWKLTTSTGAVLSFTSHTDDLVVSGVTYKSAHGFTPTTVQTSAGMNVDNLDVKGFLNAVGIVEADIYAGVYDGAAIEIFLVNYANLAHGVLKLRKGYLGNVTVSRQGFEAEIRGLLERFQRQIVEVYTPGCRADLGDSRCGVRLNPPLWAATTAYTARTVGDAMSGSVVRPTTPNGFFFKCTVAGTSGGSEPSWNATLAATTTDGSVTWTAIALTTLTGTITGVTSKRVFADSGRTEATGWFLGGLLTWLTGNNAGLSMEVKQFTNAGGAFELVFPMRNTIQVGDTYSVYPGCDKTLETCRDKFDNVINYRGEPFVPQEQSVAISAIR